MSPKLRASAFVTLICMSAGCSDELPKLKGELAETTEQLHAAQGEVTTLKAELLRMTKQLHDMQAKIGDSETRMFAAEKGKREAQAQIVEITAEKAQLAEQLEDLAKAKQGPKAQPKKPAGQ
jgi:chromosome segregation ATPase